MIRKIPLLYSATTGSNFASLLKFWSETGFAGVMLVGTAHYLKSDLGSSMVPRVLKRRQNRWGNMRGSKGTSQQNVLRDKL